MERVILHSDLNNFYASVECMLNPKLRGKYVAVCGNTSDRHGIVLAKNEAAKAMGVKTGEVIWKAKQKCPKLIIVPPNFDNYIKYSKQVMEIYCRYTDMIEPFGIDEAWLDVTGSRLIYGDGTAIADNIRRTVKKEMGLTVSVGVSFNKVFAKLGSDLKKPDAVTEIKKDSFKEKIWGLSADKMLGVGRSTAKTLGKYHINTIGDIANADSAFLKRRLGVSGETLWRYANGLEDSAVKLFSYTAPIKSIGRGITCRLDLAEDNEVWYVLSELSRQVAYKLRQNNFNAGGVQIAVKDTNLTVKQYQTPIKPTHSGKALAEAGFELFRKRYDWEKDVRALTIRAISLLPDSEPIQLDLSYNHNRFVKIDTLEQTIDGINERFGKNSVLPARMLTDIKLPARQNKTLLPNSRYDA